MSDINYVKNVDDAASAVEHLVNATNDPVLRETFTKLLIAIQAQGYAGEREIEALKFEIDIKGNYIADMERVYAKAKRRMTPVYVVNDNQEMYPVTYNTYAAAVEAVRQKHAADIEEYEKMLQEDDLPIESEVDVPEDREKNKTTIFFDMTKTLVEISRLHIGCD